MKSRNTQLVPLQYKRDGKGDDDLRDFFGAVAGATRRAAKDFSSAVRLSAMNALTSSLPKWEQELLVERMSAKNYVDQNGEASPSVGENIATARIADLNQRRRDQYDEDYIKEKEELYEQAEKAAMERVENELEIQKQRIEFLQSQLVEATGEDSQNMSNLYVSHQVSQRSDDVMSDSEKAMVSQLRRVQQKYPSLSSTTTEERDDSEEEDHPLLGSKILDLGYKRVHTMSANALGTIPVWNKQRIYRNDRVRSMADQKWKNMHLGLPGIIGLHEDVNGKLTVIDGQHRIGMMLLLEEKQKQEQQAKSNAFFIADDYCIDFDKILVEVYPEDKQPHLEDRNHAEEMFLEINKGEPVTLLDMPGVASVEDKRIITDAVEQLAYQYPGMFSPGQRCDPPMVNLDSMRDRLYGSGVLRRHKLTTAKQVLEWLVATNNKLAIKYESSESERRSIPPNAWMMASQNRFYIGLTSSWYYT